jgi:hypothetical protein
VSFPAIPTGHPLPDSPTISSQKSSTELTFSSTCTSGQQYEMPFLAGYRGQSPHEQSIDERAA